MKKIGIVSCYFKNNYGSMLQAYATKKVLDRNHISNETININENIDFKKGKRKYYLKQIFNFNFIKSKIGMIKLKFDKKVVPNLEKNIKIRNAKYAEFRKEFNLSKSCANYTSLSRMVKEKYTDILVGSDQLWLPVNVVADYYTLNWVPDEINKISYSTSFGISKIPEQYTTKYQSFLKRIQHVSVREESGVEIVKGLGLNAKLVCDPTLLLTKEEWTEIATKDSVMEEPYILCYFLGNNIEHRKFAERLREITGFKIVSLNHSDEYVAYSDVYADSVPYDIGPKEWINLIKNSEYVCTDSFHGTVFSLLFNKLFFNFRRYKETNKMSTNSRLQSLLNVAGVSKERILNGDEDISEVLKYTIDYSKVNENIETFRRSSLAWLLEAIDDRKEETKDNYITIEDKDCCSGCTACASRCPKEAIEMVADQEGFLYPKVCEEKCIRCGICSKVCPVLNEVSFHNFEQKAYLFQNKIEEVRGDSTSGGFFTAIGNAVIDKGGVVYGASFNKDFVVEHTVAMKKEELKKFRKSKYVQSDQKDCFKEIKALLESNKLVCYSGSPCQVAGLKAFLQKEYENLITVDFICRAVPSPMIFEKYKTYILKKMKAQKINNINFRDKSKYGYKYSMMTVDTDKGKYSEGIDTDPYLRAFFGNYSIRPSCYHCAFRTQKKVSDITVWDCFNINEIDKAFDDDKGTTRILIQSEKGERFFKQLKQVNVKEIPVALAISKVRELEHNMTYDSKREVFFETINNGCSMGEYFPKNMKTRINSTVRKTLSATGLYSSIKSLAKKVLRK